MLESGDYEKAEEGFSGLTDRGRYVSEAWRGMGIAELLSGNETDAALSFEKALYYVDGQDESYQRDVSLYLAHCRERQGQNDRAMEIYNNLILKDPDAETLFLRGRLSLLEDDGTQAAADFDQAVSMNPSYELYINIYEVYADRDKSADGSRYLEKALDAAEENAADHYSLGLVHYYLQDYSDARDELAKALQVNPNDGQAVFLLGKIYLETGNTADARAVYRDYTDNAETAAGAYNGLALCDIADGEYEDALSDIESGLACQDEDAAQGLLYNQIVANEKLYNWSEARTLAARYIVQYPSDEAGLREYEFLSTR